MDSVAQNGWDQLRSFSFLPLLSSILTWIFRLTKHYVTSVALGMDHTLNVLLVHRPDCSTTSRIALLRLRVDLRPGV